jgi:AraC family transcriptional regulator
MLIPMQYANIINILFFTNEVTDVTLPSPWEYEVAIRRYHYFHQKKQFEESVDTYEAWAAFAVEKGEFTYRIGSTEGLASAGTMIICPPYVPFHRTNEHPISFHYIHFKWLSPGGKVIPNDELYTTRCLSYRSMNRYYSTLQELRIYEHNRHPDGYKWRNHLLTDLFRCYAVEQEQSIHLHSSAEASADSVMVEAKALLDISYDQPCSIQSIADRFHLSSVQFSRRFQRAYSTKPSDYISTLRLSKACRLLTHTRQSIEDIALQCGYNNGFYFSRVFMAKLRTTPSRYRKDHQV